jgi:hypothetical protein
MDNQNRCSGGELFRPTVGWDFSEFPAQPPHARKDRSSNPVAGMVMTQVHRIRSTMTQSSAPNRLAHRIPKRSSCQFEADAFLTQRKP